MAIGLNPHYSEDYALEHLLQHQYLMLSLYAAQECGWQVQYLTQTGLIAYTNNGNFKFNAQFKIIINDQKATLLSTSTGNEFFDLGKNKKTVKLFIAKLEELKLRIPAAELDLRYEEIAEQLTHDAGNLLRLPDPNSLDVLKDFLSVFVPSDNYFFTPIILNLNILLFVVMAVSGVHLMAPTADSLILWGANYKPLTLAGEWWRLITSCFIHIGVLHLLMNMYALLYIGLLIEPLLGKVRFITAYLLTGLIASVTSLWWHDISVSAGASGAIFGMYGVFLALLTTSIVEKSTRKPLFISIAIFVVYNLMSGIKEGVDNAAHIGGIVSGIVFGYIMLPGLRKKESKQPEFVSVFILLAASVALTFFALKKIPNNVGKYDDYMSQMYTNDTSALSIYNISDSLPTDQKLIIIKETAISKTNENLNLMNELEQLKLPAHLQYRTRLFKKYFQLRLKSYEVYYQAIESESDIHDSLLNHYYAQIDSINKIIETHD